jgi:hypothetical protein
MVSKAILPFYLFGFGSAFRRTRFDEFEEYPFVIGVVCVYLRWFCGQYVRSGQGKGSQKPF